MNRPFILCAEDNESDIIIMRRIFQKELQAFDCIFRESVSECIHFLEEAYIRNNFPVLLLIDIKLINSNGLDLLKFVKESNRFNDTPAVVLSSSGREKDKLRAAELGCDEYFEKPKNFIDYKRTIPEIVFSMSNMNRND